MHALNANFDLSTYLTTKPKKADATEALIADRAAQVMSYWQRDDNRHYGKFSDAMNDAVCDDSLKSDLFDLWLKGDTAQLGIVLAKRMTADLVAMADQYARDELLGVLGKADERIPK